MCNISMVVNDPIMDFWVVTPCGSVDGYRNFGETCYLHFPPEGSSTYQTSRCHNSEDHYLEIKFRGIRIS
jgi:hypothetical protein